MGKVLVLDATPLIHLRKVGFWKAVKKMDFTCVTTPEVVNELRLEQENGSQAASIKELLRTERLTVKKIQIKTVPPGLSLADASVVALAQKLGAVAVIDDALARNHAKLQSVKTAYSSSLLIHSVRAGVVSVAEAVRYLDEMICNGWYCTVAAYQTIRKAIEDARVGGRNGLV